jgi:hypothetical protein
MGGWGSGSWGRANRKRTVEESLTLSMRVMRPYIKNNQSGFITWTNADGQVSTAGFLSSVHDQLCFVIHYWIGTTEHVRTVVELASTHTRNAGRRLWFLCPLASSRAACGRRVECLYLPSNGKYFGCRQCHQLTYQSCQQAHKDERFFCRWARELGFDEEIGSVIAKRAK